ncbi:transmembrane protease serine 3-like [Portunus trituberculatus]|uniref:transmembrane protease serine 3-like n=1 Tax=Portunus trituberculatus TaxID=210409 RepID=UPI001E1D0BC6|nr:transmembrane protease serine 3-like [Portunus trituberculatus]
MWACLLTCLFWALAASIPAQRKKYLSSSNCTKDNVADTSTTAVTMAGRINRPFCDECGVSQVEAGKIIGGQEASLGEYPWMAYLEVGCGGTLIKRQWVLTAAHCYYNLNKPKRYKITLGKTDISANPSGSLTLKPIKVILHKKYKPSNFENDIALLKLPYPITFTDTIKPLCVARDKDILFGSASVATGWGVKKFGAIKLPKVLHEVTLDVISEKRCKSLGSANKKYFICALTKKKDTCQGDSGGPLMVEVGAGKWAQVGIVSHGEGCALKNSPGVYTRVPAYLSWIASKANSENC